MAGEAEVDPDRAAPRPVDGAPGRSPALTLAPTAAYRHAAWVAVLGLAAFLGVYAALIGYLGWLLLRAWQGGLRGTSVLVGAAALLFLVFLVSGLLVVKHAGNPRAVELRRDREPRLFEFVDALADQVGAPRAHRVFLSADVNACVFYDLSLRNLFWPTRKNLEIGLGLVNALSVDEFRAVLAHEFGHFAQRAMLVGRWVYIAQQVLLHLVAARTWFDRMLAVLSGTDLRVAWIGWVARLYVWALRAVLDTLFLAVTATDRALGRQMEFAADRVAVAVTGSDSLVNALHRLGAADRAWSEAAAFAHSEGAAGRRVPDLFDLQHAALDSLRTILADPAMGATPATPEGVSTADHRVFAPTLATSPRMWATHPPNHEREAHAKAEYVPSTPDPRPAWYLFDHEAEHRRALTAEWLGPEPPPAPGAFAPPEPMSLAECRVRYEATVARESLDPRYQGAYLQRAIAAGARTSNELVARDAGEQAAPTPEALAAFHPPSLRERVRDLARLRAEMTQLQGLVDTVLQAPGGVIRHRGQEIPRKKLPAVLTAVRAECSALEAELDAHERACRRAHLEAATALGRGWPEYLAGLLQMLHFSTHGARSVWDALTYLHHQTAIATADGHVSSRERKVLVTAGRDLAAVLTFLWASRREVYLPEALAAACWKAGSTSVFQHPLGLDEPAPETLDGWLPAADSWASAAGAELATIADATLDTLLEAEARIRAAISSGSTLERAPMPPRVPAHYPTCLRGEERERQRRLGLWDRFQTADGPLPGALRLAVAVALLAPGVAAGVQSGAVHVITYNGLSQPITVRIGSQVRDLPPRMHAEFTSRDTELVVRTTLASGELVEEFTPPAQRPFRTYVYDVARAAVLVEEQVHYGKGEGLPARVVGNPRWVEARQDHLFEDAPERGKVGTFKTVLVALDARRAPPEDQVGALAQEADHAPLARAHLAFDRVGTPEYRQWLGLTHAVPDALELAEARAGSGHALLAHFHDLVAVSPREARAPLCRRLVARAAGLSVADAAFVDILCAPDARTRDALALEAFARFPRSVSLATLAGDAYGRRGEWKEAFEAFGVTLDHGSGLSFAPDAATERVRVARMARAEGLTLPRWSPAPGASPPHLRIGLSLEAPRLPTEHEDLWVFRHLAACDLDAARRRLASRPWPDARALLAASPGATPADHAAALALPPEDLDAPALWALLGIAQLAGAPTAPYRQLLRHRDELPADLDALLAAPDVAVAERALDAALDGSSPRTRGMLYSLAVVLMGQQAPDAWRWRAAALTFVTERPCVQRNLEGKHPATPGAPGDGSTSASSSAPSPARPVPAISGTPAASRPGRR